MHNTKMFPVFILILKRIDDGTGCFSLCYMLFAVFDNEHFAMIVCDECPNYIRVCVLIYNLIISAKQYTKILVRDIIK